MPSPDIIKRSIPRADLGAAIWEYNPSDEAIIMIADLVLPGIDVGQKSATIPTFVRENMLKDEVGVRAPAAGFARTQFGLDEVSYNAREHGLEQPIDNVLAMILEEDQFDSEMAATRTLMNKINISREIRVAGKIFNTTTWTGAQLTTDVSAKPWSDATNALPINDVESAKQKVRDLTGFYANALIINYKTWVNLSLAAQLVDRLGLAHNQALNGSLLNLETLAMVLGVSRVYVGAQAFDKADEGQAFVADDIWSTGFAMVAWIPQGENLTIEQATIGRSFFWSKMNTKEEKFVIETYDENNTDSHIVRARQFVDEKIIDASYGHLLKIEV